MTMSISNIQFDEHGNLVKKAPAIAGKSEAQLEPCEFGRKLILDYMGVEGMHFLKCSFRVILPPGIMGNDVTEVKKWADDTVHLKQDAFARIKRVNEGQSPPEYMLFVSGRGKDERCTWCRAFRTNLGKKMKDLDCAVVQKGACTFEEF